MASYLTLHQTGELQRRAEEAVQRLAACDVCPRRCGVDRLGGGRGACGTGRWAKVASWNLHFGEEEPLVGSGGSGTIFFAGCNLNCVFCQNFDISHTTVNAEEAGPERLAGIMVALQERGAENINFVTPTHVVPQILEALVLAAERGLRLPLVYNTGGYDDVGVLELLEGVVDIYMPDVKFWESRYGERYCQAPDYPERAQEAVREMHRQVGDLELDERGVATRGLLVRHLVMPGDVAGTEGWMRFLAKEISRDTYLNVMDQYRPCGRAGKFPEIGRRVTPAEFARAMEAAEEAGVTRLDRRRSMSVHRMLRFIFDDGK